MLRNALALYRHYVRVSIRSQLQYRAAIIMTVIGVLAITGTEFLAIAALFGRFGQIVGWRLPEVALFYALISITWALCDAMSHGFRPLVLSDCVGDRAIAPHDANLFDMAQKYAMVMTRDEALAALAKTGQ